MSSLVVKVEELISALANLRFIKQQLAHVGDSFSVKLSLHVQDSASCVPSSVAVKPHLAISGNVNRT